VAAVDQFSLAPLPIQMRFDETVLAEGTAFTWKRGEQHYLVTAWHNLSGRHPDTGKHLSCKTAAEPNLLRVSINQKSPLGFGIKVPWHVPLLAEGSPLWWVHPDAGLRIDIALLPIEPPEFADMYPINEMPSVPMTCPVGADVFVLGFPLGPDNGFPIWKRASIATEPQVRDETTPLYVDTATRPGMSGSPVIRRAVQGYVDEVTRINQVGAAGTRLLGIYTGRVAAADPLDAQLGMVWPISLIDKIIDGQTRQPGY
jgi:hypothetical protein